MLSGAATMFSGAATMLLMLLFLIFYSSLACYNVYRFVASSFSRAVQLYCMLFMHIIFVLTVRK